MRTAKDRRTKGAIDTIVTQRVPCDSSSTGHHKVTIVLRAEGTLASFDCECDKAAADSIAILGGVSCFKLLAEVRKLASGAARSVNDPRLKGALAGMVDAVSRGRENSYRHRRWEPPKHTPPDITKLTQKWARAASSLCLTYNYATSTEHETLTLFSFTVAVKREGAWQRGPELEAASSDEGVVDDNTCELCDAHPKIDYYVTQHCQRPKHRANVKRAIDRAIAILNARQMTSHRVLSSVLRAKSEPADKGYSRIDTIAAAWAATNQNGG